VRLICANENHIAEEANATVGIIGRGTGGEMPQIMNKLVNTARSVCSPVSHKHLPPILQ